MLHLNTKSRILSNLYDEESKFIWSCRHKYNESGDETYIADMCAGLYQNRYGNKIHPLTKKKYIVAFGSGAIGTETKKVVEKLGLKIDFFCDNSQKKWGKICQNIKIISPAELKSLVGNCFVIVTTSIPTYIKQIKCQLLEMGFVENDIFLSCSIFGRQYFEITDFLSDINPSFVDAGCYNADDSLEFIRATGGQYKKIYAFEPDDINYEKCQKAFSKFSNIDLSHFALFSENKEAVFQAFMSGSSGLSEHGETLVQSTTLDAYLQGDAVSCIKMDIEGSELEALKGAQETIKMYHPQLAICIYHKKEDLYDIPQFLYHLNPDYRFYLRHYSLCALETVLYAVK